MSLNEPLNRGTAHTYRTGFLQEPISRGEVGEHYTRADVGELIVREIEEIESQVTKLETCVAERKVLKDMSESPETVLKSPAGTLDTIYSRRLSRTGDEGGSKQGAEVAPVPQGTGDSAPRTGVMGSVVQLASAIFIKCPPAIAAPAPARGSDADGLCAEAGVGDEPCAVQLGAGEEKRDKCQETVVIDTTTTIEKTLGAGGSDDGVEGAVGAPPTGDACDAGGRGSGAEPALQPDEGQPAGEEAVKGGKEEPLAKLCEELQPAGPPDTRHEPDVLAADSVSEVDEAGECREADAEDGAADGGEGAPCAATIEPDPEGVVGQGAADGAEAVTEAVTEEEKTVDDLMGGIMQEMDNCVETCVVVEQGNEGEYTKEGVQDGQTSGAATDEGDTEERQGAATDEGGTKEQQGADKGGKEAEEEVDHIPGGQEEHGHGHPETQEGEKAERCVSSTTSSEDEERADSDTSRVEQGQEEAEEGQKGEESVGGDEPVQGGGADDAHETGQEVRKPSLIQKMGKIAVNTPPLMMSNGNLLYSVSKVVLKPVEQRLVDNLNEAMANMPVGKHVHDCGEYLNSKATHTLLDVLMAQYVLNEGILMKQYDEEGGYTADIS